MPSRQLLRVVLAGIFALLFIDSAMSQGPKADFGSDELLNDAVSDVGRLDRDQVETLIEYLATCGIPVDSKDREFFCERAKARFEIKGLNAPSLRRLISAIAITDEFIRTAWNSSLGEDRKRLMLNVQRKLEIFRRLRQAVSERYAELTSEGKRP